MEEKLFNEFEGVSRDEWQAKIVTDLKGKAFEALLWESEGLSGGPVYTKEDLPEHLPQVANPHENPEVFGHRHWVNYQPIVVKNIKQANAQALSALNAGADGLVFTITEAPDFSQLLQNIQPAYCHISWIDLSGSEDILDNYLAYLKAQGCDWDQINGFFKGNISKNLTDIPAGSKVINSSAGEFEKQTPVVELALILSNTAHQFDIFTDAGVSSEELFQHTQFELSQGTSYFTEIAKYRALRVLMPRFAQAYGVNLTTENIAILSQSSTWQEEIDDLHSYMLRATTQAMSAIIGGADALCIQPFYTVFPDQPALAERAARNISGILKEESYLNKVLDPSAGTYFIESLTADIIDQSWQLFIAFEDAGGYTALNSELIQSIYQKHSA